MCACVCSPWGSDGHSGLYHTCVKNRTQFLLLSWRSRTRSTLLPALPADGTHVIIWHVGSWDETQCCHTYSSPRIMNLKKQLKLWLLLLHSVGKQLDDRKKKMKRENWILIVWERSCVECKQKDRQTQRGPKVWGRAAIFVVFTRRPSDYTYMWGVCVNSSISTFSEVCNTSCWRSVASTRLQQSQSFTALQKKHCVCILKY